LEFKILVNTSSKSDQGKSLAI